jgi:hypothetical protein
LSFISDFLLGWLSHERTQRLGETATDLPRALNALFTTHFMQQKSFDALHNSTIGPPLKNEGGKRKQASNCALKATFAKEINPFGSLLNQHHRQCQHRRLLACH